MHIVWSVVIVLLYLQPMWQCRAVVRADDDGESEKKIAYAVVKDLLKNQKYHIYAKVFILAAGAVLTPQILFNSDIQPAALGKYLCEQPMAFCQIVLKQSIVDSIAEKWPEKVEQHKKKNPSDPIPIPMEDPTPQV